MCLPLSVIFPPISQTSLFLCRVLVAVKLLSRSLLSLLVWSFGQSNTPFSATISILVLFFNVVTLILFFPRIDSFRAKLYFKDCRMLLATIRWRFIVLGLSSKRFLWMGFIQWNIFEVLIHLHSVCISCFRFVVANEHISQKHGARFPSVCVFDLNDLFDNDHVMECCP